MIRRRTEAPINRPKISRSHTFVVALGIVIALLLSIRIAYTQTSQPVPPAASQTTVPDQPASEPSAPSDSPRSTGKVLFSRDVAAPSDSQSQNVQKIPGSPTPDSLPVTDAERNALTFTAYDLDLHIAPASASMSARAGLIIRNDSAAPLTRVVLQLTSSLHWEAFSTRNAASAMSPLAFATHRIDTDADHTGQMSEAVLSLSRPLAPGASIALTALYSGTIPPSAERLNRIGAPGDQALAADWDSIALPNSDGQTGGTALRGFGNVLWYPVSTPAIFLGGDARFFQTVGETKLRQAPATVRLRLAVEYTGDPPDAAFFCGHREQLIATSDNPALPAAESPGIATALFDTQPLGFRTLSLFITSGAASNTGTNTNPDLIAAVTGHYDTLPAYSVAANQVEPLLSDWLGARPLTPLTILDHPGQIFEDDALLVRPMRAVDPATLVPSLVHSLTHAWIRSDHAWIDEGVAQFMSLLWTERTAGRAAMLAQLEEGARALALFEPEAPASASTPNSDSASAPNSQEFSSPNASSKPASSSVPSPSVSPAGLSLADATGETFYRTKAAAVWWMLRSIVGDESLKKTLQAYRLDPKLDRDPAGLEHALARFSHKDLHWLFNDWVYRDRGLPDLTIVSVNPSQIETRNSVPSGWLVGVTVRNDGYAEAEVPVTVRSADSSETQRLRVAGRSVASTRIVFAGTPEQVQVNDGGVPETQTSVHVRQLILPHR